MLRGLCVAVILGLCCFTGCARLEVNQTGLSYFVSAQGDDANSGGRGAPFATLERAREVVRRIGRTGVLPAGGVTVQVRDGRYALARGFVLGPDDSGSEERPVVYRAFPGETVVLTVGGPAAAGTASGEPVVTFAGAEYVTWRGFTMEAVGDSAAVIREGRGNLIAGCTIRDTGGAGVVVSGSGNGVVGCDIYGTGAEGIRLEGGDRRGLVAAGNYADNNHLHDVGRRESAAALRIDGVGNRATHNLIHDVPQAAILYGGNDHVIEFNEVFRACQSGVGQGALHTGRDWGSQGNQVRCNFVHHVGAPGGQAIGVYLEGGDSGDTLERNVFCHVNRAVVIEGGHDNGVLNNVFAVCGTALAMADRSQRQSGQAGVGDEEAALRAGLEALNYRQPPWSERYPHLVGIPEDQPLRPRHNTIGRNICVGGRWIEATEEVLALQELGDNLVTAEDPGFVDPKRLDLRLREDSPAWAALPGLEPIPLRQAGVYRDPLRASWPVRYPLWQGGLTPAAAAP